MKQGVSNTILFVSFLIAQLLISNFIDFGPMLFLVIYPLFILTLPVSFSPVTVILWAFGMGLGTDLLYNGMAGLNSASLVMMAFLREPVLSLIIRKGELESEIRPGMAEMGFRRFLLYAGILMAIHHISVVFIESFSLTYFIGNLPRLLLSFSANMLLLILLEFGIFYKNWR